MNNYDELTGGSGRQVFYRADRFAAKTFFSGPLPLMEIGEDPYRIDNLSISGIAATTRIADVPGNPGDQAPIRMRIHNEPIFEADARIVRKETGAAGTRIAAQFVNTSLDLKKLLRAYREKMFIAEANSKVRGWKELVPADFRSDSVDFLHDLRHFQRELDRWDAEHGNNVSLREQMEMIQLCQNSYRDRFHEFQRIMNRHLEAHWDDRESLTEMKRFTELTITPDLLKAPNFKQAYEKPFGYPGDHIVMDYTYDGTPQGPTSIAKFIHWLGVDALECVVTRMKIVENMISDLLDKTPDGQEVSIANLACGTAQEITNILKRDHLAAPVTFNLIDQDDRALALSYGRTHPRVMHHKGRATINGYHSSFADLMTGGVLADQLPQQDMVYTVGLFDYLRQNRCRRLTASLFEKVKPGGKLVVGNLKRGPNSGIWVAEMAMDWSMYYRREDEIRDIAASVNYESMEILTDKTDRIYLLVLTKPRA